MTAPRPTSENSRGSIVSTACRSVPVAGDAIAAPAFAASSTRWTIRSTSWEGTAGGKRNDAGTYQMRFEIAVPAGTSIREPMATLQFGQLGFAIQVRAGDGTAGAGWNTSKEDELFDEWGKFVYTRVTPITGPTTVDLAFRLEGMTFPSSGTIGTITFTSTTPEDGPPIAFSVLRSNTAAAPGYITSPAG